jgi:multidrug resistance efflux pump
MLSSHGNGERAVVTKDPVTERFFRFGEVEGFILERLDGNTSPDSLCSQTAERFGAALSPETLEQFVSRLRKLGLLESSEAQPASVGGRQRRIRGNLFYLRFRAFDPDRILDWLVLRTGFFFTPSFLWISALSILVAGGITVSRWDDILLDFPRLYSFQSLVVAYLTTLVVITAHEFAHGLTCKHHGGRVREIGFFLLYFQPAFYCNVSDAWLFPERSKRLWVTFAGAYFEIFVWAIATMVWWITDPFTIINYMALVVMATSGIKTLFNLNPLIKLDGYYLLSDLLEVPNLRQRSFGYWGSKIKRLWGSAVQRIKDATPRERRIYLIYGALAWVYSVWLLSFLFSSFGGYLVGRYQGWGFAIFAAGLLVIFQNPLKKVLHTPVGPASLNARLKLWIKRLLRLALLAAIVAALFLVRTELRISGPFLVLPVHNADVRAEVEGIIQEIYADEGDMVAQGAAIATLSDRDYQADLRKVKAEIEEKQARLKLLKAGTRPEEIDVAKTLITKGEERVKFARNRLEMDATLFKESLLSKKELEDTRETLILREKELQEASDKLKVLLAGSRQEDIEATEAEITRLQAQQRYLQDQLQLLKVASPIAGIITTPKLKDRVGQAVKKGDLIAKVHEMKTLTVEIAVPEKEIADVQVGQKVVLKARAYPLLSFEGVVKSLAPIATAGATPRDQTTVRVITQIENSSLLLKPEMTGNAKIFCGEQRLLDIVSRRLIRFVKVEFWSWW